MKKYAISVFIIILGLHAEIQIPFFTGAAVKIFQYCYKDHARRARRPCVESLHATSNPTFFERRNISVFNKSPSNIMDPSVCTPDRQTTDGQRRNTRLRNLYTKGLKGI